MAIGCNLPPWDKMFYTSRKTWDSFEIENVETVFYFGKQLLPYKDTEKAIYFPINESYNSMGGKMLLAFDWALKNKEFDYIARINSSCYVDKKQLIKYVQGLEKENVFAGVEVDAIPKWMWGGAQYIISKDIVEKIVDNSKKWDYSLMEDVGLSYLVNGLNIPYTKGVACSINKRDNDWLCLGYGSESIEFTDFNDLKRLGNHFYRVKCDADRSVDELVMNELYKILK